MSTRLALLVLLGACARDPALGTERMQCHAGSACNAGLTCLSDRCVRVPNTKCVPVVESLVSIELGNYAPVEERAAKVEELRPRCEAIALSDADAACIVASRSRAQLARCPQPILMAPVATSGSGSAVTGLTGMPPECIAYVATLDRYATCAKLTVELRQSLQSVIGQLKQSWSGLGANPMPPAVIDACRQGMTAIQQAMVSFGC